MVRTWSNLRFSGSGSPNLRSNLGSNVKKTWTQAYRYPMIFKDSNSVHIQVTRYEELKSVVRFASFKLNFLNKQMGILGKVTVFYQISAKIIEDSKSKFLIRFLKLEIIPLIHILLLPYKSFSDFLLKFWNKIYL